MIVWSTTPGSTPARRIASVAAIVPSSTALTSESAPRNRPIGVRAPSRMTGVSTHPVYRRARLAPCDPDPSSSVRARSRVSSACSSAPPSTGSAGGRPADPLDAPPAAGRERAADETDLGAAAVAESQLSGADQPSLRSVATHRLGERTEAVARERRLLEPLALGERLHARLERSEETGRGGKGGEEAPDELSVALGVGSAVAGRRAPADVGERARREPSRRAHRPRAPTDR